MRTAAALLAQGRAREAEAMARGLTDANPADANAWQLLALARSKQGWWNDAAAAWERCAALAPREAMVHARLGIALVRAGRLDDADAPIERALGIDADHPVAVRAAIERLERGGDDAAALERARPVLDRLASPAGAAEVVARDGGAELASTAIDTLRRSGDAERAAAAARTLLAVPGLPPAVARQAGFTLGRALAKSGDPAGAFAAWTDANRAAAPPGPANLDPLERLIDASIATFTKDGFDDLPVNPDESPLPVLITGMPRSGSTLVEQVLDAHPQAWGAGETPAFLDAIRAVRETVPAAERRDPTPAWFGQVTPRAMIAPGQDYLAQLRRARPTSGPRGAGARAIDKNLLNVQYLGLAARMLPQATLLHCVRDPVETGLSCFMNDLSPAAFPWSGDLASIGRYHRLIDRLVDHWREVLGDRLVDVVYEEVVADPEPQMRRIVEACGLPWDDACLAFHESRRTVTTLSWDQVRRPIYREATRRSEAYGDLLDPLRTALAGD